MKSCRSAEEKFSDLCPSTNSLIASKPLSQTFLLYYCNPSPQHKLFTCLALMTIISAFTMMNHSSLCSCRRSLLACRHSVPVSAQVHVGAVPNIHAYCRIPTHLGFRRTTTWLVFLCRLYHTVVPLCIASSRITQQILLKIASGILAPWLSEDNVVSCRGIQQIIDDFDIQG